MPTLSIEDKFWSKVSKAEGGCWIWQGYIAETGYGRLNASGKTVYAHRASYEIHVGPIPEGLTIDHLCRVRACVNPDHLEVVTLKENIARSFAPSAIAARENICQRGHVLDDANVYMRNSGRRLCRTCNQMRRKLRTAEEKRARHARKAECLSSAAVSA